MIIDCNRLIPVKLSWLRAHLVVCPAIFGSRRMVTSLCVGHQNVQRTRRNGFAQLLIEQYKASSDWSFASCSNKFVKTYIVSGTRVNAPHLASGCNAFVARETDHNLRDPELKFISYGWSDVVFGSELPKFLGRSCYFKDAKIESLYDRGCGPINE